MFVKKESQRKILINEITIVCKINIKSVSTYRKKLVTDPFYFFFVCCCVLVVVSIWLKQK